MINRYINKEKNKLIVAYLFFFFFTSPILSPYIMGFTIYLHWFITFLDFDFVKYVKQKGLQNKRLILLLITVCLILNKVVLGIKIITIVITVMYLIYTKRNNYFKPLYRCVMLNVVVAIIQFVCVYIDPDLAYKIGPTNIARTIWGSFATETFTNFYTIFLIPRVSGLAREAGFLASLLCTTFMSYMIDKDVKKSKMEISLFIIGIILSFSKVSLIYLGLIFIVVFRKILNKIPVVLGAILFTSCMIFISNIVLLNKYYDPVNESITHRISGYTVMTEMRVKQLINGVDSMSNIDKTEKIQFINNIEDSLDEFTGIPQLIIHEGIIVAIIFMLFFKYYDVKFARFLIITFISFTTTYFTSAAHIALGYFIIFHYKELLDNEGKFLLKDFKSII